LLSLCSFINRVLHSRSSPVKQRRGSGAPAVADSVVPGHDGGLEVGKEREGDEEK